MKKTWKRWICLLLGAMLCFSQLNLIHAKDDVDEPQYEYGNRCLTNLRFSGTTANCTLTVTGKKSVSRISGTLNLYDLTKRKTVKKWKISKKGSVYSGNKKAKVKRKHIYKLSFSGKVYGKNSKLGEPISSFTTKKNKS